MFFNFQVNGHAVTGENEKDGVTICISPPSPRQNVQKKLFTPDGPVFQFPNGDQECVCTGHKADNSHSYTNGDVKEDSISPIDQDDAYKSSDSFIPNIIEIDMPISNMDESGNVHTGETDNQQEVDVTVHKGESESDESLRNIVNYMQNQALASKTKSLTWQNAQNSSNRSNDVKSDSISNTVENDMVKDDEKIVIDIVEENVDDKLVEKETVPKTKSAKEFRLELEKNKKDKIKSKNSDAKKSDDNKKKKSKLRQSEHGIVEKGFKKYEDDLPVFIDPNDKMRKRGKSGEVKMMDKSSPLSLDIKQDAASRVTTSRESWEKRKLRASLTKSRSLETEQAQAKSPVNNNNKDGEDDDHINEHIRKRWRLVLNVQKFQSTLQQPQMFTPLQQSKKQPLSVKITHRIVSFMLKNFYIVSYYFFPDHG